MRKTLITLLALAGVAAADDSITLKYQGSDNYNENMYGFYLSVSSDELSITPTNSTLSDFVQLESITLKGRTSDGGFTESFGLIVLNDTDNTILGYSTNTLKSVHGVNATFTFTSVYGSDLILNSADTYRFLAVGPGALGYLGNDESKTYVYSAATGNASVSTEGNIVTITGGIKNPRFRWNHNTSAVIDDCCRISSSDGSTADGLLSPYIVSMSVKNVPEPTTATLSLLARCGLAARRRRK